MEAAGGLVKHANGSYLFIYRNDKWDLPKGKIEKNEVIIEIDTWLGKNKTIGGYVKENIYKTIKKAKKKNLKVVAEYNGPIEASIKKEQKIGILKN